MAEDVAEMVRLEEEEEIMDPDLLSRRIVKMGLASPVVKTSE